MAGAASIHRPHLTAVLREEERVTPLELFFDLVFVLALTQCTALMADEPTWAGVGKGLLVLGVLWWAWVGYAWLTSVVDPDEGSVRIAMFAAMAALLVAALCVPDAFADADAGLIFALSNGVVRAMHLLLFVVASRDDPGLRHAIGGLTISTMTGVGLLVVASFTDGTLQAALWGVALTIDMAGPLVIDATGWRLNARHFAERHGLILIIALGESIVAIGVGAGAGVDLGVVVAAVLGIAIAASLWWLYFDVVALVAARRLERAQGRERNEIARDSFSLLHFPMIAGIVLLALGMKKTLGHVEDPLKLVPAAALFGGTAVYLLAHVAFRWRNIHTLNRQRLVVAILLVALIPLGAEIPSLASVAVLSAILTALVAYETIRFGELRERLRRQLLHEAASEPER